MAKRSQASKTALINAFQEEWNQTLIVYVPKNLIHSMTLGLREYIKAKRQYTKYEMQKVN